MRRYKSEVLVSLDALRCVSRVQRARWESHRVTSFSRKVRQILSMHYLWIQTRKGDKLCK